MANPITIKLDVAGQSAGIGGQSRAFPASLIAGGSVTATATDPSNAGAGTRQWTLVRPPGSSSVLTGSTSASATFPLDVAGTYLLKYTFTDGEGEESSFETDPSDATRFKSTQGAIAVLLPNGRRIPGRGESLQFTGWDIEQDQLIRDVDARLPTTGEKAALSLFEAAVPRIPTTNEKTDLGQLAGAASGTVWYANGAGRVTRLAPGSNGQILSLTGGVPDWIDVVGLEGPPGDPGDPGPPGEPGPPGSGGGGAGTHANIRDVAYAGGAVGDGATDDLAAIQAAIDFAKANGLRGIFIPKGVYLTPRAEDLGAVILHNVHDFEIVGEGPGSIIKMTGDGGDGTWYGVYVHGNCSRISFRDMAFDGNVANLTNIEEQTHNLRFGGNSTDLGLVDGVSITNCWFYNSPGDAIQMVGAPLGHPVAWTTGSVVGLGGYRTNAGNVYEALSAGTTGVTAPTGTGSSINDGGVTWRFHAVGGDVIGGVVNILIAHCDFNYCNRSGIGLQRNVDDYMIIGNRFRNTGDQAIDHEPTGGSNPENTSPRRSIICDNIIESTAGTIAVTLTGLNNTHPNSSFIFARNRVAGCIDALDCSNMLFEDNIIEPPSNHNQPVVSFRSTFNKLIFRGNTITRPVSDTDNEAVLIAATGGSNPAQVQFQGNKIEQFGIAPCANFENVPELMVQGNEFTHRHTSGSIPQSVIINANSIRSDNVLFQGNLIVNRGPGVLVNGLSVSSTFGIEGLQITFNHYRGITSGKVKLGGIGGFGALPRVPFICGNTGDGTGIDGIAVAPIIQIGGGQGLGTVGDYIYSADSDPPFSAPDGSTARRLTGAFKSRTVYTREAGNWGTGVIPATAAEFTDASPALPSPTAGWLMQDASTPLAPVVGAATLDANASPTFVNDIIGWAENGVGFTEVATQRFIFSNQALYNPNSTSVAFYGWWQFISAGAAREFYVIGATSGTPLWVAVQSTGILRINCAGVTTDGLVDHRRHVLPILAAYNRTAGRVRVRTPYETITGTYNATVTDGSFKGIGGGTGTSPVAFCLRQWVFTGAAAEAIDNAANSLTAFGW